MRQTVREAVKGLSGNKGAILFFVLVIVVIIGGVAFTATSDDDAPQTQSSSAESDGVEGPVSQPEDSDRGDGSRSSVAAMVAGFGLIGLWAVGGGVAIARAKRRQRQGATDGEPT